MVSKRYVAILAILACAWLAEGQVDPEDIGRVKTNGDSNQAVVDSLPNINFCSLEQLISFGASDKEANAILDRIHEEGPFMNIFELYELTEIDRSTVDKLRERVTVRAPGLDDPVSQRREANSYRIEQLVSDEGFSEGLADQLADQLLDPIDVNSATIDELTDIQNVSPVDAVAIKKRILSGNPIKSSRELRQTPGLSHYGYTNARPYLTYDPTEKLHLWRGFFQIRAFDSPYLPGNTDAIREDVIPANRLDVNYKLRMSYDDWKLGLSIHRGRNEDFIYEYPLRMSNSGSAGANLSIPQSKVYLEKDYTTFGPVTVKRFILGSFQAGFGQGLIFSSGDYFSPRYTGFGYNKGLTGIAGDLTSAHEFAYRGAALEARGGPFETTLLYSSGWKDAVLNPDGSINRMIVMTPRYRYDALPAFDSSYTIGTTIYDTLVDHHPGVQSYLDNTRENLFAGNLSFLPWIGARLGFSWVEALYNRPIRPTLDSNTLVLGAQVAQINDDYANEEILQSYANESSSKLWSAARSRRRLYGMDWQYVYENFSLQGEYGELEKSGSFWKVGDDPHGIVTSLYAQYSAFNLLMLYRDRSVGYDNPFDRGYGNYTRFKGGIFEDEFYLKDVTFGQLYDNSFQPQPERGFLFSGRYQVLRQLITSFEYDQWKRRSDDAEYYRWVTRLQYRPIFPLQFNLRFSDQSRAPYNSLDPLNYRTLQGRLQTRVRLTNFDELQILYSYSVTSFAPRPRLFYDPMPNGLSPVSGQGTSPAEAFGVQFRHNMARSLWVGGGATMYDGFFWNYEEGDFYVRDGNGLRMYAAAGSRIGPGLYVKIKATTEHPLPLSYIEARKNNKPVSRSSETAAQLRYAKLFSGYDVESDDFSFRIQLDYHF